MPSMQTHLELNGCQTPVTVEGEGPAIVLLHGGPGSFDYLGELANMLPAHWRRIRYDQRGGGQAGKAGPFTIAQLVADLEALRQQLGIDSWVVLGHSWGAFLALVYASEHPDAVNGLIHLSGTGLDTEWQKGYHAARRKRLPPAEQIEMLHLRQERETACDGKLASIQRRLLEITLGADFADKSHLPAVLALMAQSPQAAGVSEALMADWQAWLQTPAFRQRVGELTMPVLCLHGEADPRPATGAMTLGEVLPRGRFELMPASDHYPWLEQPAALKGMLAEFLADLGST